MTIVGRKQVVIAKIKNEAINIITRNNTDWIYLLLKMVCSRPLFLLILVFSIQFYSK